MVVENFWIAAPSLAILFEELRLISALSLNVIKTVMVPLWPYSTSRSVSNLVREMCPGWANMAVERKGKYPGFLIGPGVGSDAWDKPLAKFESRVKMRAAMKLGMAMNVLVFNIYIVPVLEFIAQLCLMDDQVVDVMTWAMHKLASGPGTWIMLQDLENLRAFSFRLDLQTINSTAQAAKLRVAATIAPDAAQRSEEIAQVQSDHLRRPFGAWHSKSFFTILLENKKNLERAGVTLARVRDRGTIGTTVTKEPTTFKVLLDH